MHKPNRQISVIQRTRNGLAIIEFLVALLIIVTLIALVIPSLSHARSVARRTNCMNNLRQVGMAMQNYELQYGTLPPGYTYAPGAHGENLSGFGWCTVILPFLDQAPLAAQLDWSQPIQAPVHDMLRTVRISSLICPSDPLNNEGGIVLLDVAMATANYAASFGPADMCVSPEDRQGMFSRNSTTRTSEVTDGMAHTLLVGERRCGSFVNAQGDSVQSITTWAGTGPAPHEPGREAAEFVLFRTGSRPSSSERDAQDASSAHAGGTCFGMADGSVRFMGSNIDLKVYRALSTRSGGEMDARLQSPK